MLELIVLCITHFVSDLVLQPREMAKEKSENFDILCGHVFIIFISFFFAGLFIFRNDVIPTDNAIAFAAVIAVVHGIQDILIWKGYKNFTKIRIMNTLEEKGSHHKAYVKDEIRGWKYWEDYWFYVTIGLDQLLHYLLIVILYNSIGV